MTLILMRVHDNFVQQMVTKFNDCDFSKCKYVQGISVHFLLSFSLKSRTCIYFCYFKSCWCMYAYLYLSKHNKDLKKQNSIPLYASGVIYILCFNAVILKNVIRSKYSTFIANTLFGFHSRNVILPKYL